MEKQFNGLFGIRVRYFTTASKTILRQSLWLMLFLLGWASTAQAIPASERAVLIELYASTNGASWTSNTNWNSGVGTECTWTRVSCDVVGHDNVNALIFDYNNLVGTLPSLDGLTMLGYFSVLNNQVSGSIPPLNGLKSLVGFWASNNQLTGSIPSLNGLTGLQTFFVYNNQLTGTIPSLSGLTALQSLSVTGNQLSGSIPPLSGLTALQFFDASGNQLTGSIPSLNGLTALQTFHVLSNQLTGSIPSLSGLTALQSFRVGWNQLTGSIPSLSGLTALQVFQAKKNQLTGSIPSLSGLTALQSFDVSKNQLTGPVPAAPTSLLAGQSNLCGNGLVSSGDPAIDAAWMAAQSTDVTKGGVAGGNWLACQTAVTPTLYTLSVARTGTGSGTLSSDTGGISCGADCWADYAGGTSVTLTATPASGSTFSGWGGACTGTGSCVVTMSAAKSVTATFKPEPFVATTTSTITATSATITTNLTFDTPDVGKQGAVYVTAWTPASGLGSLGILSAPTNHALSVTTTRDNPYSGGAVNRRQEALGTLLAAADPNAFVLVQLTSSGWQLVVDGQLIPYVSGVLGDALSSLSILNNTNPANLLGAQFCVGYGTSAAEMVAAGRMMQIAAIDSGSTVTASGSCNVAAGITAIEFYKADIGHYFMTASTDEATALDNKPEWNWVRTGKTFNIWLSQSAAPSNASPVCRFFGVFANGTVGSHFYTVDAAECDMVKGRLDWGWGYENDAFYAVKPAADGTCPSGTSPIYRAYNNGMGGAPNHRYVATQAEIDAMVAQGWVSEGTALCGVQ